ncbi:MAG: ChaN family lipoprotein [Deltaproteobacteria bacterium]|nr:ChaN family lipoprotein [Deltaproteobacteria bacterium]
MLHNRKKFLKLQEEVLENIKKEVKTLLEKIPPSLSKYYQEYKKEFRRIESLSNKKELIEQVLSSDIVYNGDFHTFEHAQRMALRILREIIHMKKKIIFATEVVLIKHQDILNKFIAGKISEKDFLKKIDYDQTWGFDWKNFKPLFDFARKYKIQVLALNSAQARGQLEISKGSDIPRRDQNAAEILAQALKRYPGYLIYVLFGDLHLARNHLPTKVDRLVRPNPTRTIIYQNSETVYRKLAQMGKEHDIDVVKLAKGVYCVNNATPWVKLQSYIHWREKVDAVQPRFSGATFGFESEHIVDYTDQILHYLKVICHFLEISPSGLEGFSVYTLDDLDFLDELRKKLPRRHFSWIQKLVRSAKSFYVPRERLIYLSDLNINEAGENATQFLYTLLSGWNYFYLPLEFQFYSDIVRHALGFFGSKVINHKRKSEKLLDCEEFAHRSDLGSSERVLFKQTVAQAVINAKKREDEYLKTKKYEYPFKKYRSSGKLEMTNLKLGMTGRIEKSSKWRLIVVEASKILGQMLGDRLYRGVIIGQISLEDVRKIFRKKMNSETAALSFYLLLIDELSSIRLVYKSRKEHL